MGSTEIEVVAGRYRLREQLGRGGMGVVWRAHDERLDRDVAVKVLHPWVADEPELRVRFEREAAALARLEHPNVVRLYDVIDDRGATVLVMELIEGDSLAALVAGRSLPWDEVRVLIAPVAAALAHAHARGVVHRDLTPANVLVERADGPARRHRLRSRAARALLEQPPRLRRARRNARVLGARSRRPDATPAPRRTSTRSASSLFRMLDGQRAVRRARIASRPGCGAPTRTLRRSASVAPDAPPEAVRARRLAPRRDPTRRADAIAVDRRSAAIRRSSTTRRT